MEQFFSRLLDMSLTGSLVICLVLLFRFALKKQPKIWSYALWAVVLFRLLCPVSFSASLSALNVVRPEVERTTQNVSRVSYVADPVQTRPTSQKPSPTVSVSIRKPAETMEPLAVAGWIWLGGAGVMVAYSLISYLRLRRKLVGATPWKRNIYLVDYLDSPFVMGIFLPKIYIPTSIDETQRRLIVVHEDCHIRRLDHIWKLLAFLALCVHWFNPLVWLSFVLAGKDMEMSCDEEVIRRLGDHVRADYATALLRLATKRTLITGTPLAFGEGDTKGRVKNMANWKKPKVWVSLLCALVCLAVLAACGLNPEQTQLQTEPKAVPQGTEIVTVTMPEGYTYDEKSMYITRNSDGKLVGGLAIYPIPDGVYDPEDKWFDWLYKVGIPDFEDESLRCTGGISDFRGGWCADFSSDVPEGEEVTVSRRHDFLAIEGKVYDIWVDTLEVTPHLFQTAFQFNREPDETVPPEEQEDYEAIMKCRAVMDLVEDSSVHILQDQRDEQGHWSTNSTYIHEDTWLEITDIDPDSVNIGEGGEDWSCRIAYLYAEECYYQNDADYMPAYSEIEWKQWPYELQGPNCWLGYHALNRTMATYLGTDKTGDGECIRLRYNAPRSEAADTDHYFVNFYFDNGDSFQKAEIIFTYDGEEIIQTETIVTTDEKTVSREIQKALKNAKKTKLSKEEQKEFEMCRRVVEAIQSGAVEISQTITDNGSGEVSTVDFLQNKDGDWMYTTDALSGALSVGGKEFTGTGAPGEGLTWKETDDAEDRSPWLAKFQWSEENIGFFRSNTVGNGQWMAILFVNNGEYIVRFFFDQEGNFLKLELQIPDAEMTPVETLLSQDQGEINARIQAEFRLAQEQNKG